MVVYIIMGILAAAMLHGSWIACGHDGEKEKIVQYNKEDDNK